MKNDIPAVIKIYNKTCTNKPLNEQIILKGTPPAKKVNLEDIMTAEEINKLILKKQKEKAKKLKNN